MVMDADDPTKSRGFGFVTFSTRQALEEACAARDGTDLDGR
eukprot:SAG31_NODE_3093_length_4682_cov_47.973816_4_plen_41_part_00